MRHAGGGVAAAQLFDGYSRRRSDRPKGSICQDCRSKFRSCALKVQAGWRVRTLPSLVRGWSSVKKYPVVTAATETQHIRIIYAAMGRRDYRPFQCRLCTE